MNRYAHLSELNIYHNTLDTWLLYSWHPTLGRIGRTVLAGCGIYL